MKVSFRVKKMTCASCVGKVSDALEMLEGVEEATVSINTEKATIEYDESVGLEEIIEAIEEIGYGVATTRKSFKVEDMTCASCGQKIEKALKKDKRVLEANANFARKEVSLKILEGAITDREIMELIGKAGYSAKKEEQGDRKLESEKELEKLKKLLGLGWLGVLLMVPFWAQANFGFLIGRIVPLSEFWNSVILGAIATPTALLVGWPTVHKKTFMSLKAFDINMETLITLGVVAAWTAGVFSFFFDIPSFFMVSGMILAFHLLGQYLETKAKGKASKAIEKLLELEADTARLEKDGEMHEVPLQEVQPGDLMVVKPGEKIPTDGIVKKGEGSVDESMVTGESMPERKTEGDEVIGSTINQEGRLKVEATKVGKDTFLSQVVKMVEEAQATKLPIQKLADKVTSKFVPTVVVVAIITGITWFFAAGFLLPVLGWAEGFLPWVNPELGRVGLTLFASVAVLVISCPCALGLATPTSVMVGTGKGAEEGILFRKGDALQIIRELDVVVLDKTGTLTKGKPELTDLWAKENEEELLRKAASVENGSEHPIARAVVRAAKEKGIDLEELEEFENVKGKGVFGRLGDKKVMVGSKKLLETEDISISGNAEEKWINLQNEGKTSFFVAVENEVLGVISVADELKEDSGKAVDFFKKRGIEPIILTGDNRRVGEAIADKVGIDRVEANVLPQEKSEKVKKLQKEKGRRKVAMIGDGVNDAPALAQADVGIAIGTGTDIAIESGDVILVQGRLSAATKAFKISEETMKNIKQNLFWAFGYNSVAIPVAALGLLHPVIAAGAMALSSVTVVGNALRLKNKKIADGS